MLVRLIVALCFVVILWMKMLIGLNILQILYSSQLTCDNAKVQTVIYSFDYADYADYTDSVTSSNILYFTATDSSSRTTFRPMNL